MRVRLAPENVLLRPIRWTPPEDEEEEPSPSEESIWRDMPDDLLDDPDAFAPERREAWLRRRLHHLGLRLEKSRRRSGLRRVYCTWSIKDHNRVVMRLGTHLQVWALDLIEKWVDSHFE